jgi:hypothetical protein
MSDPGSLRVIDFLERVGYAPDHLTIVRYFIEGMGKNPVVARTTEDYIRLAVECRRTRPKTRRSDLIVAGATPKEVASWIIYEVLVTAIALERIGPRTACEPVVAEVAFDRIFPGSSEDGVVTAVARQGVVAAQATYLVVATQAMATFVSRCANHEIITFGAPAAARAAVEG